MFHYLWPLALAVLSNVFYHICAKSIPDGMNPFASLTITYAVAAAASAVMYFLLGRGTSLMAEYSRLNWASFLLGVVIVGLEVGFIYMYKAGWPLSTAQVIQGAILSVILIFVGVGLFKEGLTWNKLAGIAVCLAGIGLINL